VKTKFEGSKIERKNLALLKVTTMNYILENGSGKN